WLTSFWLFAVWQQGLAGGYPLDSGNTSISFTINRFGMRWVSADFSDLRGELTLDRQGSGGRLSVAVRTASIHCRDSYWNERLRSEAWLDTTRFPEMTYRSTRIEFSGDDRATVYGILTLRGVSRPVTLEVTDIECGADADPQGSCRFRGRAELKR